MKQLTQAYHFQQAARKPDPAHVPAARNGDYAGQLRGAYSAPAPLYSYLSQE
jgi:hypothetical protein